MLQFVNLLQTLVCKLKIYYFFQIAFISNKILITEPKSADKDIILLTLILLVQLKVAVCSIFSWTILVDDKHLLTEKLGTKPQWKTYLRKGKASKLVLQVTGWYGDMLAPCAFAERKGSVWIRWFAVEMQKNFLHFTALF